MCARKPIVFACKAYNDIVKEANAGMSIQPECSESMANAIIAFYNMSQNERNALGDNGRRYVEKHHDIPCLVDKIEYSIYL
jgi:glycosyltransferase involved in cell wall biosynthesis